MRHRIRHPDEKFDYGFAGRRSNRPTISLSHRIISLAQQKITVFVCTVLLATAGVAYIVQSPPSYTARGLLLVENTRLDPGRQELVPSTGIVDLPMVDTQVQIIESDAIALKVIEALNLTDDDENITSRGWLTTINNAIVEGTLKLLQAIREDHDEPPQATHLGLPAFSRNLSAKRVGNTYTIEVRFTAGKPKRAAQVVNEVIEIYLADQAAAGAMAAASASAWLRERVKELGPRTRVVSVAVPPLEPDGPGRLMVFGAFVGLGVLSGIGIAVARVALDTNLRDPLDAESKLGAAFLGAVSRFSGAARFDFIERHQISPEPVPEKFIPLETPAEWRRSLDLPHSDLANSIVRIRVELARVNGPSVIGVTSIMEGGGTTTIASNLALSAAATGTRVLLVDGNGYKPDISNKLHPKAERGLMDIAAGAATLNEVIGERANSKVHIVPWRGGYLSSHSPQFHAEFAKHVQAWRTEFDLVIFDLPPLLLSADVAFARTFVDSILLIIQWGHVPAALARTALSAANINDADLLGFVFNKVTPSAIMQNTFPIESYIDRSNGVTHNTAQRQ